jgi:putative ABC transport system permease protein
MTWRRWIHAIPARLRAVFRTRRVEQDLDDELAFHVAMQTRANTQGGMTDAEAYRRARVGIGGVEQTKERSRDVLPLRWARDAMQDVRYGLRGLRKSPRFTVAAVLTVVLGVGANATIFSVLNPLLFKPLPYPEPDRIVGLYRTSPQSQEWPHSIGNFLDYRDRNRVFEELTAWTHRDASLAEPDQPAERLLSIRATGDFFAVLGVEPLLGRTFTAADDRSGVEPVVVLSHRVWQRRFAGDRNIVGRTIRLDGVNVTVIGVMPDSFDYPLFWGPVEIWRPLALPPALINRGNNYLRSIGRLRPGVTVVQADDAMKAIVKQVLAEHLDLGQNQSVRVAPLSVATPVQRRVSGFAFALTFLVLLIACVNLANLQLARTAARAREFAIRGAIGGAKARLMRQSLTESLLVSVIGGALAIPLSFWCTQMIASRLFAELPSVRIAMEPITLLFGFCCALVTGVVFGVVPAWLASRADINDALKQSTQSAVTNRTPHRFRNALIVAEIAFALVTLAGSVSLIRGLQRLTAVDPGWRVDGLFTARVNLPISRYREADKQLAFYSALDARVHSLPGVTGVAISSSSVPASPYNASSTFVAEGREDIVLAYRETVTPAYFDTLGIRLRRGRPFTYDDVNGKPRVTIVNESMARRVWPNEDPIGKRIGLYFGRPEQQEWRTVVGVVADVTFPSFASTGNIDTEMTTYHPMAQEPQPTANITVRTTEQRDAIAAGLAREVATLDRDIPVHSLMTAREAEARSTATLSLLSNVLGAFAVLGLALAAVGIFGVVSYSTTQRAGEIGMRMALGARQSTVLWLVLRQGITLTLVGAIVGLAGGLGLGRVLAWLMPNLPAAEVVLVLGASVFMSAVALAAFFVPAWRASKTNPILVLRHE